MKRTALVFLVWLALAASAAAQNKFSGTTKCGKPDKDYKIEVGDRPEHAFEILQLKCAYTKGGEIAGVQIKEEIDTGFYETNGGTARGPWSGYMILANGDKAYLRGEDTLVLKQGVPQTSAGHFDFNGGTGKLKGIKGKGSYKGVIAPDGTAILEVQGEYELAK